MLRGENDGRMKGRGEGGPVAPFIYERRGISCLPMFVLIFFCGGVEDAASHDGFR